MNIIIEKIAIPILILTGIAICIYNPMNFGSLQRILAGAALVILLMSLGAWLNRQNRSKSPVPAANGPDPVKSVVPSLTPVPMTTPSVTSVLSPEPEIDSILGKFKSHTQAQIQSMLQPYRDKRVRFSGTVTDVKQSRSHPGYEVQFMPSNSKSYSYLGFDKNWNNYLHTVKKGDVLKISGIIDSIDNYGVNFTGCEIIP